MSTLTNDFITNLNNLNKFILTCINAVYVLSAACFAIPIKLSFNLGDNTSGDNNSDTPFELIVNRGVINSLQSQLFKLCQNTQDYILSFIFDNLQNSNNILNLTKNEELLANDRNGKFWFVLQNINVNENKKSKNIKKEVKKKLQLMIQKKYLIKIMLYHIQTNYQIKMHANVKFLNEQM